jgi:hypothetical protein
MAKKGALVLLGGEAMALVPLTVAKGGREKGVDALSLPKPPSEGLVEGREIDAVQ